MSREAICKAAAISCVAWLAIAALLALIIIAVK